MKQRSQRDEVAYFGSNVDWVGDAAAESGVIGGPDSVISVGDATTGVTDVDPTGTRLIVCEVPNESDVDPLRALREMYPELPVLAVVSDDAAVNDALAAGAADVFVRRDSVDETALLARRIETVATAPVEPPVETDSTERLLDAIDDSFYLLDTDGSLRRWNDRLEQVTGYDETKLEGLSAQDLFTGADKARVADAIETVSETGSATVEAELVGKDGDTTPVEFTGTLVADTAGSPQGIVGIGRDLTERHERESQLVRLQQAVRILTDSAPVTLFEITADERVGTVRGETLRKHLNQEVTPGASIEKVFADRPAMRHHVGAALDGDPVHEFVNVGAATLEMWLQPALDETGTVSRVIGLVLDVTEREERAVMLDQIQANAGEVIWLSTPEKESMDFITDAYEDIWGRSPETLTEDPVSFVEAIHPDDRDRVKTALKTQQEDPDGYEETYRVVQPDGEVRWVHDQSAGVYEDGDLTRIVGIAADITVQKRRERELRLTNRAVETAPVGIAIHETATSASPITYVNDAFEAITGYDNTSLVGERVTVLDSDDTDPQRIQRIASAVETGECASETLVLSRADGTPFWGQVEVAPVTDDDGDTTNVVTFIQDVTESKEHEQEIERHLTEFGEVLAEDLTAPLQAAKDQLNAAADDDPAESIRQAEQSIERATSLVEDLATVHSYSVESRQLSESMRGSTPVPTEPKE